MALADSCGIRERGCATLQLEEGGGVWIGR